MVHGFWGWPGVNWFIWLPGMVIIIFVLWLLLKSLIQESGRPYSRDKTPLDILKERYAKGEIDKKEFEERKANLLKN
ncbi:MAG: SHOCT domain-containing protein [Candidatus Marinimicrobia bacterium]|nr:SHOCT domain-containing protein [Candidatus Neomarinimicrobiota bacterium]